MGDWTDLASKIIDKAAILGNNIAMDQGTYCHVIPKAASSPADLRGWTKSSSAGEPKLHYVDQVREIPLVGGSLVNPNDLTFGVSWAYGGHWHGKGRYIRDAHAYCDIKNISVAQEFDASVHWDEGTYEGPEDDPIVSMSCTITVLWKQFWLTETNWRVGFTIYGDGRGTRDYWSA
jgi:hypothetical protein